MYPVIMDVRLKPGNMIITLLESVADIHGASPARRNLQPGITKRVLCERK